MEIVTRLYSIYNGRRINTGNLWSDMVFRKVVRTKDKLQILDSFGIDKTNLEEALAGGARFIELKVADAGVKYIIDVAFFLQHAVCRQFGNKHGVRYYCRLSHWESSTVPNGGVKKHG